MKQNINIAGRLLRFGIAILLVIIAVWQRSWIAAAFAAFVFYEAYAGWCAFNQLIGKNSCKVDREKK